MTGWPSEAVVLVAAKLSQRFYEKLGDELANELVDWFNQVDATYRADLRELNELNFSRFDAKLGQSFAEQDARWERRFAEQDAKWERRFGEVDAKLHALRSDVVKRTLVFWATTAPAVMGLYLR